jgi:hypothetical protein
MRVKMRQIKRYFLRGTNMAKNTGKGYRIGSVKNESQVKNPKTGDWTKRSHKDGEFMDVKEDGKPFKGVAKEPDKRRKKS